MPRTTALTLALALALAGCGGTSPGPEHASPSEPPPEITDENVHEVARAYWRMDPASRARLAWRDALITHLAGGSEALVARGDYDEVVERLASLSELLTPEDIAAGRVPAAVVPLARYVVTEGSPRGDEGRVMGALLLLAAVGEEAEEARAERERIARWGRDVRAGLGNPIEQYGGMIQVWEQHEQIAPDPEVLEMLARLYTEQRDALLGAFGPDGEGLSPTSQMRFEHLRLAPLLVQRAPLDVAAVYLRHGDLERAIEHVGRMGDASEIEERLIAILEQARENNADGARALEELARGFIRARPTISAAICRQGVRRFPEDGRFPLCLGRVAMERGRPTTASAWYAEAVRLSPDERAVYDEALSQLAELIERGLFEQTVGSSRVLAREALEVLRERERRWPEAAAPVTREQILLHLGRAEMSAGNVEAARERFVESLAARETPEGHRELGLLLERMGQPDEAAIHYRGALDLMPGESPEDQLARAELTEDLGDAFRQAGNETQAARLYRQALAVWAELGGQIRPDRRAIVDTRVGILQSRLGQGEAAAEAFQRAMESAPDWRGPYTEILAHLVVADPNVELAEQVLRRATYQLTLEREWRVYFALWVQAVAARSSDEPEAEVAMLLGELARGEGWSARLAAFGHADLSDEELVEAATSPGERAEALFYTGTRLLASGDVPGARRRFEAVLETNMVSFYEYAMAQELLAALPSGG